MWNKVIGGIFGAVALAATVASAIMFAGFAVLFWDISLGMKMIYSGLVLAIFAIICNAIADFLYG